VSGWGGVPVKSLFSKEKAGSGWRGLGGVGGVRVKLLKNNEMAGSGSPYPLTGIYIPPVCERGITPEIDWQARAK